MSLRMDPAPPSTAEVPPSDTLVMEAPSVSSSGDLAAPEATSPEALPEAPLEGAPRERALPEEPLAPPSSRFVVSEPAAPPSTRWLVFAAIAGLVVGLAGVAFAVGTWMGRGGREVASQPTVQRAPRTRTPAGRASTALDKALTAVGLACDVNVDGELSVEILELSLEACGRDEVDKLRRQREREVLEDRLEDVRPRTPTSPPSTSAPPRPRGAPADRTAAPDPRGGGAAPRPSCRQSCAAGRSSCQADCGKEPSDAARYGPYQTCISHCVADESRCRLGCR
jgi:hypothetical protein